VWRGTDLILARPVAVKVLQDGYVQYPESLERFRSEARHAGAVSHEGIARIYDYGEPKGLDPPFLVMELVDGPSLADVLSSGPLDLLRAVDVVAQAAAGLHAAHLAGLVHRDIKPGNLLVSRTGRVKITDFGISHAVGSAPITRTGVLVGTPGYLAPERVGGASATCASDLYSLGVVAYECLAGAPPFSGTPLEVALAHRMGPMPPLPPAVPAEVAALVRWLTAKDPGARPASAGDVAAHAGSLRDRMSAAAVVPAGAPAPPPRTRVPARNATLDTAGRQRERRAGPRWARVAGLLPGRVAGLLPGRVAGLRLGRVAGLPSAAAAAALAALTAVALASVIGAVPQHNPAAAPRATPKAGAPRAALAEVSGSTLIGQPVGAVRLKLLRLGFVVRVRWRAAGQVPAGRVVSVQPGGWLPRGGLVTLVGALRTRSTVGISAGTGAHGNAGPRSGRQHGHGNGGDGGDVGNGNNGGSQD
jgi:Protein kinase domain